MRLVKFNDHGEPSLVERTGDRIPLYAILSHTWGTDNEEVSYEDLQKGTGMHKSGYDKIRFCAQRAEQDGLRFFWIDTCCINKANFTELSAAINSMFRWYREAARCYVYLADVPNPRDPASTAIESAFSLSRWFTRGWTLQELIAPTSLQFFSQSGELLGSKASRLHQGHRITGIDVDALQGRSLSEFSIETRISWATRRQTSVEEDSAYCLLGIFDINMPLIYGEGRQKALDRLRRKVQKSLNLASSEQDRTSWNAEAVQALGQPYVAKPSIPYQDTESVLKILKGHSRPVLAVAFSSDGKTLASASRDRTIKLWDTQSFVVVQTLKGHKSAINAIAFSPDGKLLASVSSDKTVKLWDLQSSGRALRTLKGHSGWINAVAFSPDSSLVASASGDTTVKQWNTGLSTSKPHQTLEGHTDWVNAVAYSPDNKILASASSDATIKLWNTISGLAFRTLTAHSSLVNAVAFSCNGKQLASASVDCTVKLWDAQSWTAKWTLKGHSSYGNAVVFSPDSKTLASASHDMDVRLWDTRSGAALEVLKNHSDFVSAVAFSPDGKMLASASGDKTVTIWRMASEAV
jgi:WD40 repeat protein